jgi:hypothetical protein
MGATGWEWHVPPEFDALTQEGPHFRGRDFFKPEDTRLVEWLRADYPPREHSWRGRDLFKPEDTRSVEWFRGRDLLR